MLEQFDTDGDGELSDEEKDALREYLREWVRGEHLAAHRALVRDRRSPYVLSSYGKGRISRSGNPDGLRRGEIRDIRTGPGAKIGETADFCCLECDLIVFM